VIDGSIKLLAERNTIELVQHSLVKAFTDYSLIIRGAKAAAARIRVTLERRGIDIDMIDLYADDFDPRPTVGAISRHPMIARPSPAMSRGSGWPRSSFLSFRNGGLMRRRS
jgi:hypothetical protein